MPYTEQLTIPGATVAPSKAALTGKVLADAAVNFAMSGKAPRTRETYNFHWRQFTAWCAEQEVQALPCAPHIVAMYLTHLALAGWQVATISVTLSAIAEAHKAIGHPSPRLDPALRQTWAGIRRRLGTAPTQKIAISIQDLQRLVNATSPRKLIGVRDRALILLGFASALRRSELAVLNAEDITEDNDGLRVLVRRSKSDQEARGREIGIPYGSNPKTCPVRALRAWKEASGIKAGPIFVGMSHGHLSDTAMNHWAVARLLKKYAERAGLDHENIAGHSLRAGRVTAAAQAGKPEHVIMQQTGHRDVLTLRGYIRRATLFQENAAAGIGL